MTDSVLETLLSVIMSPPQWPLARGILSHFSSRTGQAGVMLVEEIVLTLN